jgi:L-lactate dehydrogenase complex protein LldG
MSGRDTILASVREALSAGRQAGWIPKDHPAHHEAEGSVRQLEEANPALLKERFRARLEKLGDRVHFVRSAELAGVLQALLKERSLHQGVATDAALALAGNALAPHYKPCDGKQAAFAADHALVLADWAIAETGTLVFEHPPGTPRLITIAPPLQLVLLPIARLLPDVVDAIDRLRHLPPREGVVWVTGSSRTADIDGILVRGAHGPKELVVFVLEE